MGWRVPAQQGLGNAAAARRHGGSCFVFGARQLAMLLWTQKIHYRIGCKRIQMESRLGIINVDFAPLPLQCRPILPLDDRVRKPNIHLYHHLNNHTHPDFSTFIWHFIPTPEARPAQPNYSSNTSLHSSPSNLVHKAISHNPLAAKLSLRPLRSGPTQLQATHGFSATITTQRKQGEIENH